jgi:redox-sensitive bicupin YhaK (pirin superfamily)
MTFRIENARSQSSPTARVFQNGSFVAWPLYETSDIVMLRLAVNSGAAVFVESSDFAYLLFVVNGSLSVLTPAEQISCSANEGVEIPENSSFTLSATSQGRLELVVVAGKQMLPGSFFNTLNNTYTNN